MAYSELAEKKDELLEAYIADDDYLNDATCDLFTELRAGYEAFKTGDIDDKLSTFDALFKKLEKSIIGADRLEQEASDALVSYREKGDIETYKEYRDAA